MPQNSGDVGLQPATFVPPVWNSDQNFLHSEWMQQRWAVAACVDYNYSFQNDMHGRNWQIKGFRGCLESALEPVQEKISDYDIANTIWESPN
jgi:hypothetical protein